jgi:hypothetical protein
MGSAWETEEGDTNENEKAVDPMQEPAPIAGTATISGAIAEGVTARQE